MCLKIDPYFISDNRYSFSVGSNSVILISLIYHLTQLALSQAHLKQILDFELMQHCTKKFLSNVTSRTVI